MIPIPGVRVPGLPLLLLNSDADLSQPMFALGKPETRNPEPEHLVLALNGRSVIIGLISWTPFDIAPQTGPLLGWH